MSVMVKKKKIIPVHEQVSDSNNLVMASNFLFSIQVVNMALVKPIARQCSAGEPIVASSTSTESNQTRSISDRGEQPVHTNEHSAEKSESNSLSV